MERGKRKEDERKIGRRKERFKNKYMQRERERMARREESKNEAGRAR